MTLYLADPTRQFLADDRPAGRLLLEPYRRALAVLGAIQAPPQTKGRAPGHPYGPAGSGVQRAGALIKVQREAPTLLRAALGTGGLRPKLVALGLRTDAYQPLDERLRLTRGCLAVLAECRQPTEVVTWSDLILRDLDLLHDLARSACLRVLIRLVTLDAHVARQLNARAPPPARRLYAIHRLAQLGVPVGVLVAPDAMGQAYGREASREGVPPQDGSIAATLLAAAQAGASFARLGDEPHGHSLPGDAAARARLIARHDAFRALRHVAGLRGSGPRLRTSGFQTPAPRSLQPHLF
ncbi:MAG: hypothetical protein O2894_11760 [Planctomycetota bacterium]|nr:hypothetical protein [Planctomycetota bacterium]